MAEKVQEKTMTTNTGERLLRLRTWKGAAAVTAVTALAVGLAVPSGAATKPRQPSAVYTIPQRGMNITFYDSGALSDSELKSNARQTMKYIKSLGGNYVSISFPLFTDSVTSNTVQAGYSTPTPARLALVVNEGRAQGLSVAVRPLIDEKALRPKWRGVLAPSNLTTWFARYSSSIAPYLTMSQANKVSMFQISNELQSMNDKVQWKALLANAQKTFKGTFQFTSTYWPTGMKTYAPASFGLDAYTGVNIAPTGSVASLTTAFNKILHQYKLPAAIPAITVTEVGIMAQSGAYQTPSQVTLFGPPAPQVLNPSIQANWFTAHCQLVRTNKMRGLFFWALTFPGDPAAAADYLHPARFTPAAVTAIRNCFTGK